MIRETERKQLYSDLSSFATWARVHGPHYVLLLLVTVSNSYLRNFIFLPIAWFARCDNLSTLVVSLGFRSVCVYVHLLTHICYSIAYLFLCWTSESIDTPVWWVQWPPRWLPYSSVLDFYMCSITKLKGHRQQGNLLLTTSSPCFLLQSFHQLALVMLLAQMHNSHQDFVAKMVHCLQWLVHRVLCTVEQDQTLHWEILYSEKESKRLYLRKLRRPFFLTLQGLLIAWWFCSFHPTTMSENKGGRKGHYQTNYFLIA